ncbi:hypothetical protein RirG_077120 [Rhizophagus irregularis DAOM 197198w]|uniref:Uncharacterized protein n=1 Tax=Rhizophagus irregularis (strain DAOM 197198w) TaxID=1432141 RepID=A0A015JW75_RHIIW|nr:hypothetical protein RirG_077120 [Rhizophagus irregularis DAOM 197198w]
MNIKGGVIVLYCKTRWMTTYKSIDNILRVKAVLENMAANHSDLLTNDKIKPIICLWNFFNELKVLGFILNPLCKAVLALERREVDLSDCYLELAQISLAIKKLPRQVYSEFRNYCIEKINARFNEFDDNDYLLAFFLTLFSEMRIVKYAEVTAQKLGMDLTKAHTLCSHLLKYKNKESPFN